MMCAQLVFVCLCGCLFLVVQLILFQFEFVYQTMMMCRLMNEADKSYQLLILCTQIWVEKSKPDKTKTESEHILFMNCVAIRMIVITVHTN